MLRELSLKFGPSPRKEAVAFAPGPMTVIVGPNNSGKSLSLREIEKYIKSKPTDIDPDDFYIIDGIIPLLPRPGSLRDRVYAEIQSDYHPLRSAWEGQVGVSVPAILRGEAELNVQTIGSILRVLENIGHTKTLAAQKKLDMARLRPPAVDDPNDDDSVISSIIRLGKSLILFLEQNKELFEKWATQDPDGVVGTLIENDIIRLEGYLRLFSEYTVLLDGKTRLGLTNPARTHNLYAEPQNYIMRLWKNREQLERLRAYILDAFQQHLAIDMTSMSQAEFVLSDNPPGIHERSQDEEALLYFQSATSIKEFSDGLKSYIGLHANLMSEDYRVILIDEPEAFLHPPLARRLGENLTSLAAERGASVIVATHSSDFLIGCVESQHPINVIRLGYRKGVASARLLEAEELRKMMNDPLLRSTGVLSALFHESAVVCEGDSDSAFYQEVNERLRRHAKVQEPRESYANDCLFLNAHSKQSVPRLMGALRQMGIASVAVVDLDLLKDKKVAADLLKNAGLGDPASETIGGMKSRLYDVFKAEAKKRNPDASDEKIKSHTSRLIKDGGIKNLSNEKDERALESFLSFMAKEGVFVLSRGELERWLPSLSEGLGKQGWLANMFERMGSLNDPDTYVGPTDGDVWEFVRRIARWLDEHSVDPPSQ